MTFAAYTLADVFLTMVYFFIFFIWIWLLITVFIDIFRSHDLNGWAKALWVLFVVILPWLGVLVYLIARGGKMQHRRIEEAKHQQEAFGEYVRTVAGTGGGTSTAEELHRLADLRDRGVISEQEFESLKAKALGTASSA